MAYGVGGGAGHRQDSRPSPVPLPSKKWASRATANDNKMKKRIKNYRKHVKHEKRLKHRNVKIFRGKYSKRLKRNKK